MHLNACKIRIRSPIDLPPAEELIEYRTRVADSMVFNEPTFCSVRSFVGRAADHGYYRFDVSRVPAAQEYSLK